MSPLFNRLTAHATQNLGATLEYKPPVWFAAGGLKFGCVDILSHTISFEQGALNPIQMCIVLAHECGHIVDGNTFETPSEYLWAYRKNTLEYEIRAWVFGEYILRNCHGSYLVPAYRMRMRQSLYSYRRCWPERFKALYGNGLHV